ELAAQKGRSVRYAWLEANRSYPGSAQNAAMLLHNRHTHEGLPPVAPRESDSAVTEPADLRFWYLSSGGHVTGPVAESAGRRMLAGLKDLFGLAPAMAEEPAQRMLGRNTLYRVVTEVPEGPGTIAPLLLTPNRTTPAAVATRVLGSVGVPESSPLEAMTRFRAGGRVALVGDDGSVTLQEDFEYGPEAVSFDEASAIEQARSHVMKHDELPTDARLSDVMRVNSTRIDPVTGDETDESTHAYIVEWGRDFDGVPVAGIEGDRVSAVVTVGGVCQMQRSWRQVRGKGAEVNVIPGRKALETLAAEGERVLGLPGTMNVTGMRLVYYSNRPGKSQSVMWPAWEIELTTPDDETANPVAVYVDARNGRMLTD
ncbi:MAG: hypothetical protein Q8M66_01025, partial [Actinomycetota bacterium]|nr:hypothetical protein [Actinomycetota bacterium]